MTHISKFIHAICDKVNKNNKLQCNTEKAVKCREYLYDTISHELLAYHV